MAHVKVKTYSNSATKIEVTIPLKNVNSNPFGSISCVLLGAYPMVLLLTRWFEKPLMSVGKVLNMNNIAAAG
ncbi:hypothetical protein HMPREF0776_1251, partial [Staphylococcus aureus subsp. aureus USA300_TCH959]